MNLSNYFKLLKKYKYIIAAIMLCVGATSFYLVRNLPNTYLSYTRVSTGIVDNTQQILDNSDNSQESKVKQEFSNLIQLVQLKKVLDQVSYKLMLHDITSDTPYRNASKNLKDLNTAAKKHAIEVYTQKYNKAEPLSLWDMDQLGLHKLLASMKYDDGSLLDKLLVYRLNSSDFIEISYESENPLLSAFVVNTVTEEFFKYYVSIVKENQLKSVTFLENLLRQKQGYMNEKVEELKGYKIQNRVLNLAEQAKSLYGQIADFETRKQLTEKDIEAYTGALNGIDEKFSSKDRKFLEASMSPLNEEIALLKDKVTLKNDQFIKSNYDARLGNQLDSLKALLERQVNKASDRYNYSPLTSKQNLLAQKLQLEVNLEIARNSIKTLSEEIKTLNSKFDKLVPHEAVIQSYESDIDIAGKEYIEVLKKYNQSSLESSLAVKLKQVEIGMPGDAKPSKKMILMALSVIISLVLCLVVLFVLFYLDDSLKQPFELANKSNLPVLGYLNFVHHLPSSFAEIWKKPQTDHEVLLFKKLFRSIHFEINHDHHTAKTIAITSMNNGEGKTLFSMGLANSFLLMNKSVLLVDGNFGNPTISLQLKPNVYAEDFFKDASNYPNLATASGISIIGNKGGDYSAFELFKEETINTRLQELRLKYDVIIIETDSLSALNKSKEWILFADKVIAVFQSGETIKSSKKEYVNFLLSLEEKFSGWVINKARLDKKDRFL